MLIKFLNIIKVAVPLELSNLEILCIDVIYNDFKQRFITANRASTYNVQRTQEFLDYMNNLCDVN